MGTILSITVLVASCSVYNQNYTYPQNLSDKNQIASANNHGLRTYSSFFPFLIIDKLLKMSQKDKRKIGYIHLR